MRVQRLMPHDATLYRSTMLLAYEIHPEAFTSTSAERSSYPKAWWESRLATGVHAHEVVYGAWIDENLIGVAGINFHTQEKIKHKSSVFGMYVDRKHRRAGIGCQLLTSVLNEARSRLVVQTVQLTVTEGNVAAEKLYAGAGFKRYGVEPLAIQVSSTYLSKVHMWCDLSELEQTDTTSSAYNDIPGQ